MSRETPSFPISPADQGVEINSSVDGFGNLSIFNKNPVLQYSWQYNLINEELLSTTLTGSGSASASNSMLTLQTTAAINSSSTVSTIRKLKYRPGQSVDIEFTGLFTTGKAGSTQLIGWGNTIDGVFVGYNGSSFGVLHRNNSVDTWVSQSNFDDPLDSTGESKTSIDPTKVNVYKILVPYLGAGDIRFYIHKSSTNNWREFHRIPITGTLTTLSMKNPCLSITAQVTNTTNDTNIIVKCGCWAGFVSGPQSFTSSIEKSAYNTKGTITTEVSVLSIRNNTTFNSETNLTEVYPKSVSIAVDGTKNSVIRVYHNSTVAGASYSNIDTNVSCVASDTSGTTVSGGHIEYIYALDKVGSIIIDLSKYHHSVLQPSDTFTVTCESASATECTVALIWAEDF